MWPVWIPFPISWWRATVCIIWLVALLATLRVLGFWGVLLAAIASNTALDIPFVLLGILLPYIVFAYIYDFLFGKKHEGYAKNLPAPNSIKEARLMFLGALVSLPLAIMVMLPI